MHVPSAAPGIAYSPHKQGQLRTALLGWLERQGATGQAATLALLKVSLYPCTWSTKLPLYQLLSSSTQRTMEKGRDTCTVEGTNVECLFGLLYCQFLNKS